MYDAQALSETLTKELMPLIERWNRDAYDRGYRAGLAAARRDTEGRLRQVAMCSSLRGEGKDGDVSGS